METPLIIIGSAPCAMADLAALPLISCDHMLVGLDSVDIWLGRAEYLITYHPEDIPECLERRRSVGGNTDFIQVISHIAAPGVTMVQPHERPSGSSSLLGVFAALGMGYERVVLAGCPLTDPEYVIKNNYRRGWQYHIDRYAGKVRSMSGWTKDFLGAPTEAWLHEN